MSVTYLDVYNDALLKIGNPPLDIGDVTSDLYLWLTQLYPRAMRQVIFDFEWGCQIKRAILTQDTTAPAFGFDYRYALPYDCVRVLGMYPEGYEYSTEGNYLLTQVDDTNLDPGVGVLYLASLMVSSAPEWVTDTDYFYGDFVSESSTIYLCYENHTSNVFATDLAAGLWEATTYRYLDDIQPLLMEALVCKLAYLLTYKIVQSMSFRGELIKEYEWIKLRAKQTDNMQGSVDDEEGSTEWVDAGR
jgi:hypothetical protein